jgi:hypothetical protein
MSQKPAPVAEAPHEVFTVSFTPGSRDEAGRFMGGTEMRVLATHAGKLYAGNGYWEDRPGPEGLQGAEILVLDGPGARWRVDHVFDEQLPDGRRRDLAVPALEEVTFSTDGNGARLPVPVAILIAANWDLSGTARVFSRDDATSAWTAATIAHAPPRTSCRRCAVSAGTATGRPESTGCLPGRIRAESSAAPMIQP